MDAIYSDDVNQLWHYLAPLVIAPPAPTETCLDVLNLTLESYNDEVSARSLLSLPKAQPNEASRAGQNGGVCRSGDAD
jgi:hypothetical protein